MCRGCWVGSREMTRKRRGKCCLQLEELFDPLGVFFCLSCGFFSHPLEDLFVRVKEVGRSLVGGGSSSGGGGLIWWMWCQYEQCHAYRRIDDRVGHDGDNDGKEMTIERQERSCGVWFDRG